MKTIPNGIRCLIENRNSGNVMHYTKLYQFINVTFFIRELKYLQKQEQKQFQDLATKENLALEQQERKFEQERQNLERTYENDLELLSRQQRYVFF